MTHDPGPLPESDAGLVDHPTGTIHPTVAQAAEKAFWEAGGTVWARGPMNAALIAAAFAQAKLDAAPILQRIATHARCVACGHRHRDHADPDACFAVTAGTPCSCPGFVTPHTNPIRGGLVCVCGHATEFHNLNDKGERTGCSTATGHTGQPCDCKVYVTREDGSAT